MFRPKSKSLLLIATAVLFGAAACDAQAGGWFRRRGTPTPAPAPVANPAPAVPAARIVPTGAPLGSAPTAPYVYDRGALTGATLGTFHPTPYVMVRGDNFIGGGYSPLDAYGDVTMSLYGPISSFRTTSAPVLNYARGYDGSARVVEGTSFSNPILPRLSPVVYPTQATYYYGFRQSGNPPWWPSAINWIDQN